MWNTLKYLLGKKKSKINTKDISFNGIIFNEDKLIANKFNDYFLKSIDDIVNIKENKNMTNTEIRLERKIESSFEKFNEVTPNEINKIVKNLKNKKVTEEGISTEFLKLAWKSIKDIMLILINKSLQEGVFPEEWKTITIILIPKIIGSTKAEEHRPVNMLPIYEKVMETAVKNQLLQYIEDNDILIDDQSGRITHVRRHYRIQ